jgi:hypothetical protein
MIITKIYIIAYFLLYLVKKITLSFRANGITQIFPILFLKGGDFDQVICIFRFSFLYKNIFQRIHKKVNDVYISPNNLFKGVKYFYDPIPL